MRNIQQREITDRTRHLLLQHPGLRLGIVYGSAVTEAFNNQSDIDIAVLFKEPLTADQKMALVGELAVALKREIDLVDLYNLHGPLLQQILTKGVVVYQKSEQVLFKLLKRMIYNQSDFMPLYRRELRNRVERFISG